MRRKLIIGDMNLPARLTPPKTGKITRRSRNMPYLCIKISTSLASLGGRSPTKILPPSRGWMGIRLKTARITLMMINDGIKFINGASGEKGIIENLRTIESRLARVMLLSGPARLIMAASRRGFSRLNGSN